MSREKRDFEERRMCRKMIEMRERFEVINIGGNRSLSEQDMIKICLSKRTEQKNGNVQSIASVV